VIISGGSRGLGATLASSCLKAGYCVATYSRSETPALEAMTKGGEERFFWQSVDAADADAVNRFVRETMARFGRVDGAVNNAGTGLDGVLATMRPADIRRMVDLNLCGAIYLTQSVSKAMLRQKCGSIVNISSVNAVRGHSGVAAYSATKAGLDGMTRALARELGSRNIRVNSVAPGYFESDMVAQLDDAAKARIVRRTPLGRLGTTEDIAEVVMFLLSDRARFITGQTVVVDGGITC
jgi:3-oxoacyl-[acyl-carrier protein] reductase